MTSGGPLRIEWGESAWIAVRHFNDGDYFEAHDVWEEIWTDERGASRLFYQAMIQAAVGCYKAGFGVHRGAVRLLTRSLAKFEAVGAVDVPFEAALFIDDVRRFLDLVLRVGPEGLAALAAEDYPRIRAGGRIPGDAVAHGGTVHRD